MSQKYVIEEIRKDRKISQQELANKLGINRSLMSHIETGKTLPTFQMLLEMARILNCYATDLYKDEDLKSIEDEKGI